jgi:superfamily II DNA or RNA helicase
LVQSLLRENRDVKTLVFTARADDAYAVALDNLIPVVTAEVGRAEREEILTRFRAGSLHAIAAARVLNEGIDVPDATVAILVGGALGEREYFQRIGRVLRPAAGKTARVVEIVTIGTLDNRRADARWRNLAA